MAQQVFTIDGRAYNVRVMSLTRSFEVLDGENTGRTIADGAMFRDIIGTYYNYEMEIDCSKLSPGDYDELWEILSAPVDSHAVSFPYGHAGVLMQQMYVSSGSDQLQRVEDGKNFWAGFKIKYIAMRAKRVP